MLVVAARRRGVATAGMGWVGLAGLWGGVLGARLAHWLAVEPGLLLAQPVALLDPRSGGRTILGGIVGGWLAVEATKRALGIHRSTGDLFAWALPVGEAIGRIGCWLNGCCYGRPCDLPWAVWQHGAWRHPTQAYSMLVCGLVLGVLARAAPRVRREGDLFRVYLVAYGIGRFLVEVFRDQDGATGALSAGQGASLALVAAAWLWWRRLGSLSAP